MILVLSVIWTTETADLRLTEEPEVYLRNQGQPYVYLKDQMRCGFKRKKQLVEINVQLKPNVYIDENVHFLTIWH